MPTPPTAYDETAKGPGLSGLLEILRRRRMLAVLPFLFVLTAAVSLAVFLPSLWTARSLVLVNRQAIPERYVTPTVQADIEARLLTLSQEILTPERLTQIARQYGLYRNARSTDELRPTTTSSRCDRRHHRNAAITLRLPLVDGPLYVTFQLSWTYPASE